MALMYVPSVLTCQIACCHRRTSRPAAASSSFRACRWSAARCRPRCEGGGESCASRNQYRTRI
jgi:hypothetical protein